MTLRNVLKTQEFRSLTDQEALDALLSTVEISRTSTPLTYSGLNLALINVGVDPVILIGARAKLKSLPIGGDDLEAMLLSGGVDFTLDPVRIQIQANIETGVLTVDQQTLCEAALQVGIRTGARWIKEGLNVEPSLQDIISVRTTIASEEITEWVRVRCNEVLTAIDAGTVLTVETARTALGAV